LTLTLGPGQLHWAPLAYVIVVSSETQLVLDPCDVRRTHFSKLDLEFYCVRLTFVDL